MNRIVSFFKKNTALLLVFLGALLIEIFVFNLRSFQTAGYEEKRIDSSYGIELIGGVFDANGDIVMNDDAEYVVLNINGFGYPLNNIRFDVECLGDGLSTGKKDTVCIVECSTFDDALFEKIGDDGTSYFVNGAVTSVQADIVHDLEESYYVYLNPFGNTHRLQLVLYPASGMAQKLRIHELVFNAVKPIRFNLVRLTAVLILLIVLYYLVINPALWKEDCVTYKKWKTVLCFGVFALFSVFASFWMLSDNAIINEDFSPYNELAKAILKGRLYVGEAGDTVKAAQGYSVFWRGDSTEVMFDYALYDGKYYVYFGLLPCLVFYLPYQLITGADLSNAAPGLILRLLVVALVGRLIWIIIKKHYRNTPIAMFLLMWWGTVCGMYIPALMTEMVMFYDIPILSGLVLTLSGACFWGDIAGLDSQKDRLKVLLGSVCMAAVSLCRPTMLIYGLIILLFMAWNRKSEIKTMARKDTVSLVLAASAPYIIFAVICMVYNAVRFGSPFDFGASYNATTYPIEGASLFLPYVIVRSFYEYLLKPPFVDFSFPYTGFTGWEKVRDAGNIMVLFVVKGGILAANPFTWGIVLIGHYRDALKQKKIFYPLLTCLAAALFLMVYGVVYTSSIYTRYTLEFSPVIFICGCVMLMELYGSAAALAEERFWNGVRIVLATVLLVSIVWGVLQLCCAGTGNAGMVMGNTELWHAMKYAFRIF
ncbi:MAG: hypothetical protein IKO53_02855 [Lachnospiraceae bacterium]|nr:hypothetical protein [Lachnospiraceae bacterium]